jgi:hypothetical protein
MLGPNDFRGIYAIIPTPSKPGVERWDAVDMVDLDETARAIDRLVADGIHGLIVLGTTGECATLKPSAAPTGFSWDCQRGSRSPPTWPWNIIAASPKASRASCW